MERRLLPINAWIALHQGGAGWPHPLSEQGFALHRFEVAVTVSSGNLVIDATSVRTRPPTVAAFESKSSSIKRDQARKYAEVTPAHVKRHAGLGVDHATAGMVVVYGCPTEGRETVKAELDGMGLAFSLLVVGDSSVRLEAEVGGELTSFNETVPGPPPRYVALDADSSEADFQEHLIPALVAEASRGAPFVNLDTLLRSVLPFWDVYGERVRRDLRKKAREALARALDKSLGASFAFEPRPEAGDRSNVPVIRVLRNPAAFDPRGQTQSWQKLGRDAARALGRPRRVEAPGQATLFDDLGESVDQS
jgi:hypothetical protein